MNKAKELLFVEVTGSVLVFFFYLQWDEDWHRKSRGLWRPCEAVSSSVKVFWQVRCVCVDKQPCSFRFC
jgi:hypothetical protein